MATTPSPATFHLAWHRRDVESLAAGRPIPFLLIPSGLRVFVGTKAFAVISDAGRPLEERQANPYDLLSLRSPGAAEGKPSANERLLIAKLQNRALRAGHILPAILETIQKPAWSRLVVQSSTFALLQRAGGG